MHVEMALAAWKADKNRESGAMQHFVFCSKSAATTGDDLMCEDTTYGALEVQLEGDWRVYRSRLIIAKREGTHCMYSVTFYSTVNYSTYNVYIYINMYIYNVQRTPIFIYIHIHTVYIYIHIIRHMLIYV